MMLCLLLDQLRHQPSPTYPPDPAAFEFALQSNRVLQTQRPHIAPRVWQGLISVRMQRTTGSELIL